MIMIARVMILITNFDVLLISVQNWPPIEVEIDKIEAFNYRLQFDNCDIFFGTITDLI